MCRVLVTGCAGFIGSNLVRYLTARRPEWRIIGLDALTYAGTLENLPVEMRGLGHPGFQFWHGSVTNSGLVDMLASEADYIVHLAAETHVTRSIFDNRLFFETDVIGTQTVANAVVKAAGRVKRLVHISSSEVYGTARLDTMSEEHPLEPMSPYASAKCGADRLVHSYRVTYRIPATILRPFNCYGPRQHLEKVVPRFITSVLLGEPITVHGEGEAARDFVHVEDVCDAILRVLEAAAGAVEGEVFNIASGRHRSVRSIAEDVIAMMAADVRIVNTRDRPGQVIRHTGDSSKLCSRLGWSASRTWQAGLRHTIDWYRDNRDGWQRQTWMRQVPIINAQGERELY